MGGDFCNKPFPAAMNRTAATASGETFRKQFPAAMNRTGAAPDRKLSAIVSCRHELQSYHTAPGNLLNSQGALP